jgi:hypothetical protein
LATDGCLGNSLREVNALRSTTPVYLPHVSMSIKTPAFKQGVYAWRNIEKAAIALIRGHAVFMFCEEK